VTHGGRVIDKVIGGTPNGYDLDTHNGKIRLTAGDTALTGNIFTGSTDLPTAEFIHITAIYDGSNIRYYLNGAPDGDSLSMISIPANDLPLHIGTRDTELSHFFEGIIDEARVSHVARSASWVKMCYENQKLGSNIVAIEKLKTNLTWQ